MSQPRVHPFGLHYKLQSLRTAVVSEATLINLERQRQLVGKTDRDAIHALFDAELSRLFAWEDYLRRCIENELSSLPPAALKEPRGECLPRSLAQIAAQLSDELDDDDPLMQFILWFCVARIFSAMVGVSIDLIETREQLLDEMRKRLKPLPAGSEKGGREVVTTAATLKPKPRKH